jgi:WD40 repeat protein
MTNSLTASTGIKVGASSIEQRPGYTIRTLTGHRRGIEALQFNRRMEKIISGGSDGQIYLWDLDSGTCLNSLIGHEDRISCLEMDETNIVSGSHDKTIRVWDTTEGVCKFKMAKRIQYNIYF